MATEALNRGPMGRRQFLRAGVAGLGALGLADLLRMRAQATIAGRPRRDTACILVWLDGGPSHLDTYDLKPDAPTEFRGKFMPIRSKVPGIDVCELLPRHAQLADKFTLIRSCSHSEADHAKGAQYMLSGRTSPGPNGLEPAIRFPDLGSIVKWAGPLGRNGLPSYVGVPATSRVGGPRLSRHDVRALRSAVQSQQARLPGPEPGPVGCRHRPAPRPHGATAEFRRHAARPGPPRPDGGHRQLRA